MASLDEIETRRGGNDSARIEELIDVFKWPDGKWVQVRLLDRGLLPVSTHWVPIIGSKSGKASKIPRLCLNIDPESGKAIKGNCPYCNLGDAARAQDHYFFNAIIRELQEDQPKKSVKPTENERETGFKDIDSRSWTPVRAIRLPGGLLEQFKAQKDLNKHKNKKTGEIKKYGVNHNKYGVDFNVMYDSTTKGAAKYKISKEGRTPLTEEEQEYLVYDLNPVAITKELGLKTLEEAKRDIKTLTLATDDGESSQKGKGRRVIDEDDDVDLDEDDDTKSKSKKSKHRDDDDDDDDKPFKKGKSKKSKHRDDDDDDDDEDEDEEDEKPSKSKKSKSKHRDDDDDDDEDEPKGKSKKSKHRDDDDDDEDEDEEDEKPSKSKKGKKSKKSKSKHRDDDEDEDDEDEDD